MYMSQSSAALASLESALLEYDRLYGVLVQAQIDLRGGSGAQSFEIANLVNAVRIQRDACKRTINALSRA